ncbi:MAG: DUF3850 domain-containing protein [Eggerthellaceae bacterium]|nr:DUF3850 domain-containing protein [Eggerthellaceae bacterium]
MKHILKIERPFADAVVEGRKKFEVRRNDRGFNAGDTVEFRCVEGGAEARHKINGKRYRIAYVLSGHGLREAFVAFGIEDAGKDGD